MPTGPRILVVDDNDANRALLRRCLERIGYQVDEAEDGAAALALAGDERFAVVLLDIVMPGLSGFDVLETLRATYSPAELPVLMVSANDDRERRATAARLGANGFIAKPIDVRHVVSSIAALLT